MEECYREVVDNNAEGQVILLDAKQHSTKLFIVTWKEGYIKRGLTIHTGSLHENAESSIKWPGQISDPFQVNQRVRQGGILSADLCKLYINPLLTRLESANIGMRLGNISTNCTA